MAESLGRLVGWTTQRWSCGITSAKWPRRFTWTVGPTQSRQRWKVSGRGSTPRPSCQSRSRGRNTRKARVVSWSNP
uniref:Uncharacterized protein n=1 Tax=uncultured marine virus TaxID=186617 RepID=A0A0F7L462_9VIRU|nr:hypothetical protein [uncultured marine virus]